MINKTKNNNAKHIQKKLDASSDSLEKKKVFLNTIAKFCDKCGSAYSLNDLNIVQESNFSTIIHFSCQNCKSNHIATFIKPMGVSSRTPINTDLQISELKKFAKYDKVSSNEVLDVYELLEDEDKLSVEELKKALKTS